ncbi:hypothetical protein [Comamonas flocculans]|nr:hypothetical protein [Comamonas flocculans]
MLIALQTTHLVGRFFFLADSIQQLAVHSGYRPLSQTSHTPQGRAQ